MSRMRIDDEEIRDADIFEILLDNFPDIIHSVNEKGQIVYTNKRAEILLNYSRDELIGMSVHEIYSDEVQEAVKAGFSNLKQKGDKTVESVLKAKDGKTLPVEIRSFSIYDDAGAFIRTFSILRDIRPIKELQASLVHASRLAAIGELSSGVAHDINNPLTVILLSNEMVLRELGKGAPDEAAVGRLESFSGDIQRASKSIQKLADHLRNFSRGMADKYVEVDIASCIEDALFITSNKIKTVNLDIQFDAELETYLTTGISNNIEQVFANLISNACDAVMDGEKRTLSITVEASTFDNHPSWLTTVTDTGSGIPENELEDIFQSFYTTKDKGKGTGLGLSITRGIIRDHKGDIIVSSIEGKGTSFMIHLLQSPPADA